MVRQFWEADLKGKLFMAGLTLALMASIAYGAAHSIQIAHSL